MIACKMPILKRKIKGTFIYDMLMTIRIRIECYDDLKYELRMLFMGKTNHYASSSASMVPGSLTISAMGSNVFFLLLGS